VERPQHLPRSTNTETRCGDDVIAEQPVGGVRFDDHVLPVAVLLPTRLDIATPSMLLGFPGLRYRTRFDPRPGAHGLAVFGPTGPNPWTWPVPQTPTQAVTLRHQLALNCGVTLIDTPPLSALPPQPAARSAPRSEECRPSGAATVVFTIP